MTTFKELERTIERFKEETRANIDIEFEPSYAVLKITYNFSGGATQYKMGFTTMDKLVSHFDGIIAGLRMAAKKEI